MNQLVSVQAIAVEHRVTQRFPEGEFDVLLLSADAARFRDQVHEPVHKGRDQAGIAPHLGAHFERSASELGFVQQRLQRLETPNANHLSTSFRPSVRALVCGAGTSRSNFAGKENQRCADKAGAAQHPKAIEKAEKSRLLLKDSRQLGFRMQCGIRGSEAVRRKISRQGSECFLITLLEWRDVSN